MAYSSDWRGQAASRKARDWQEESDPRRLVPAFATGDLGSVGRIESSRGTTTCNRSATCIHALQTDGKIPGTVGPEEFLASSRGTP